ncbi:hypothetical protein [Pseudescherichia sp. L3]|nr:hypothetical protein [Pseudescherichia sp. L3]MCR4457557.1 hypothetical protein [Pseudescherichia sp. L3]
MSRVDDIDLYPIQRKDLATIMKKIRKHFGTFLGQRKEMGHVLGHKKGR